jgi:predicted dehydrogenase
MKKILFVGYGSIGARHVNNILKFTDHEIIICTKRMDLKSLNNKRIKIFNSLEKSLSENPDIGFITNETSFHIDIATKLAKKGLDLFIEKPLSNSMKGVKQLETITKKKKLISMVGCNMRFYPPLVKIKNLLEKN